MSENKPRKQVKLILTSEYLLEVPAHWTPDDVIFHYGASNAVKTISEKELPPHVEELEL